MKNRLLPTTWLLALAMLMPAIAATARDTRPTNLPAVWIYTFDGADITSKTSYKYCTLRYIDEENTTTTYDSVQIRGRGNSTWNMPKRPYRIKFAKKERFLGPGYAKARSWTLLANAADKTMMRNAVTSAMGQWLGLPYSPAARFVDLYVNSVYRGTYQISDRIDIRPHRVDIAEQDELLTAASDITGGYLLECDNSYDFTMGVDGFATATYNVPVRIHQPDIDVLQSRQRNYIQRYVNTFERRLSGSNFTDSAQGYRPMVDSASLANWYVATEVSANVDGLYSTYFYKERGDDRLHFGPLWDYDIAYNNDNRTDRPNATTNNTTRQMMADVGYGNTRLWVRRMWEDPWFGRLVSRRLNEAIADGLQDYLYGVIDSLAAVMAESQRLNYNRWGIGTRVYHEMVIFSSYSQYVADLKQFIASHLAYLSTEFASRRASEPTPPFVPGEYYYTISNSRTQTRFDVSATTKDVVCNSAGSAPSQEWQIVKVGEYFHIVNRANGLALNDPTPGEVTATTGIGTQLNVAESNPSDTRQLWSIVAQGNKGFYNLTNASTNHTANLSGGMTTDNTPVISYTTDSRNSVSENRLWKLTATDAITAIVPPVAAEPENYALAYNPQSQELHFGSDTPGALTFTAEVYTAAGEKVGSFKAGERFSLAAFPAGVYIVKWLHRSAKFLKR